MGGSPPKVPKYQNAADFDQQYKEHANRPNVNTPFASQSWSRGPNGEWNQNTELSPWLKGTYDNAPPVDWGSLPALDYGAEAGKKAETAAYDSSVSRLNPEWNQRDEQTRSQLANAGLDPNSEAARGSMSQLSAARNDAYGGARRDAVEQGRSAANDAFRNSSLARQQTLSEMLRKHGLGLEDASKLAGGGFTNMPDFNQLGSNRLGVEQGQFQDELDAWLKKHQVDMETGKFIADNYWKFAQVAAGM